MNVEVMQDGEIRVATDRWVAYLALNGQLHVYELRDGRWEWAGWGIAYRNPGNVDWHTKPPFDVIDPMERAIYGTKVGQDWLMRQWYPWWHKAVWG